jgi:hypothetical protein
MWAMGGGLPARQLDANFGEHAFKLEPVSR